MFKFFVMDQKYKIKKSATRKNLFLILYHWDLYDLKTVLLVRLWILPWQTDGMLYMLFR